MKGQATDVNHISMQWNSHASKPSVTTHLDRVLLKYFTWSVKYKYHSFLYRYAQSQLTDKENPSLRVFNLLNIYKRTNVMQLGSMFICICNIALHVSDAFCVRLQEHLEIVEAASGE